MTTPGSWSRRTALFALALASVWIVTPASAGARPEILAAGTFSPWAATVDQTTGDIYFTDGLNDQIRRLTPSGAMTIVAGNGVYGFSGDGGQALDAALAPVDLAFHAGSLYVSTFVLDRGAGGLIASEHRIRRIDPNGVITTVAGSATQGRAGDGGQATSAQLFFPTSMTFDPQGNLYIDDWGNGAIRRVDAAGVITTATGPLATFRRWSDIAADPYGTLYASDGVNRGVWQLVPDIGTVRQVAGNGLQGDGNDGGLAITTPLWDPTATAVDRSGNVYIADPYSKSRLFRKVDQTGFISSFAGLRPVDLEIDANGQDIIAVLRSSSCEIDRVTPTGASTRLALGVC